MDERALIEAVKRGDIKAFESIVDRHSRRLFSLIYRFVHNHEDTEDLMQVVWMNLYRNIARFKGNCSIYTYLYRIGVNASINWIRKRRTKELISRLVPFIKQPDDPLTQSIKDEELRTLERGIDGLPARQKAVFILRREQDLSFAQIGEIENITENNAKVNYPQALLNLKKFLKKEKVI